MPRRTASSDTTRFAELVWMTGLEAAALTGHLQTTEAGLRAWMRGTTEPDPGTMQRIRRLVPRPRRRRTSFTFADLFAGIGGMRYGFEKAGGECVFSSEIDKNARVSYLTNFPDPDGSHPFNRDIREIVRPREQMPAFDVLAAGFPCQPFSLAGVSKKNALGRPHGFACKDQGNLFFNIADILQERQPPAFLLENVRNLERHDQGRTFQAIMDVLEGRHPDFPGVRYEVHKRVIDARAWVPQHRERVFLVGFRNDAPEFPRVPFDFAKVLAKAPAVPPLLETVLHEPRQDKPDGQFVARKGRAHERYVLSEHLWDYLGRYAEKHRALGHGFGCSVVWPTDHARTLSARYHKDGSEILVGRKPVRGRERTPRRLTPLECARLMGFDSDDRIWTPSPWVSDTQLYRQFGNAVVVPVIEAIAAEMARHLRAILAQPAEGYRLAANA